MATSIRLDTITESRLDNLASSTGRTKAYYLRELIKKGIDDLEDYYSASVVMARVRTGQEAVFTSAQVRQNLGLDD
jgi:RHH-type transcriptional regulator, rel operon repressor / antitoxin RelB